MSELSATALPIDYEDPGMLEAILRELIAKIREVDRLFTAALTLTAAVEVTDSARLQRAADTALEKLCNRVGGNCQLIMELVRDAAKTMPLVWLRWLVGLLLVHDLVLAPLVQLIGRWLRDRAPAA